MTKTVDLVKDFDTARDACHYLDSLASKGLPYEHVGDHLYIVFDDEDEHEKWLELATEPGGFYEREAKRNMSKKTTDSMSVDELDRFLDELDAMEVE